MIAVIYWLKPEMAVWYELALASKIALLGRLIVLGALSFAIVAGVVGVRIRDFGAASEAIAK